MRVGRDGLVFCCITKYHRCGTLRQHSTFIIPQFSWPTSAGILSWFPYSGSYKVAMKESARAVVSSKAQCPLQSSCFLFWRIYFFIALNLMGVCFFKASKREVYRAGSSLQRFTCKVRPTRIISFFT